MGALHPSDEWPAGPASPRLTGAEVHLWRWSLAALAEGAEALVRAEERARAARFHAAADGRAWLGGRAGLRVVLARYLGGPPDAVALALDPGGKPRLAGGGGLHFNLSHAGGLAVAAVTRAGPVGVDVEPVRPRVRPAALVRRLAPAERAAWEAAAPEARDALLARVWTRKEAVAKALGAGLALGLASFAVPAGVDLADDAAPTFDAPPPGAEGPWTLRAVTPAPGFAGALASPARLGALRGFTLGA